MTSFCWFIRFSPPYFASLKASVSKSCSFLWTPYILSCLVKRLSLLNHFHFRNRSGSSWHQKISCPNRKSSSFLVRQSALTAATSTSESRRRPKPPPPPTSLATPGPKRSSSRRGRIKRSSRKPMSRQTKSNALELHLSLVIFELHFIRLFSSANRN